MTSSDVAACLRDALTKVQSGAALSSEAEYADVMNLYRELGAELARGTRREEPVTGASVMLSTGKSGMGEQTVVDAVRAIRRGEIVIVTDDEDRENEGDLIMASEHATTEAIAFMVRYTSGVICVSMPGDRIDELKLPPMVVNNEDPKGTAFTVSVDAKDGTTTGISAGDRAETLRQLADPKRTAGAFNRPGHIFPLRCRDGGTVKREGHTEATVDLCLLAGLRPCGALSEVVSADGLTMMRTPELKAFAREHGLAYTTIADIVAYRTVHGMLDAIRPIG